MSRGHGKKNKKEEEVQSELPFEPEQPAEQPAVEQSSPSETDLSKVPSKYHKFSKGEK